MIFTSTNANKNDKKLKLTLEVFIFKRNVGISE